MGWRHAVLLTGCLAGVAQMSPVRADVGRCLIVVESRTYLKGRCDIAIQAGGSFTVGVSDTSRSEHFAYVGIADDATRARGSWNGVDADSHAGSDLGILKRKGACWRNSHAKVCAWRDRLPR